LYGYCASGPVGAADASGLSPFGTLDDAWTGFSEWFSGTDTVDGQGNPVRIGGWPALGNQGGNAMTVDGTVHLNDHEDFENYLNNEDWQKHEGRHVYQEDCLYSGNAPLFVLDTVLQYAQYGSHDAAPNEIDADNATGAPYKNPFEKNPWEWVTDILSGPDQDMYP
jgi:hypothetical protein